MPDEHPPQQHRHWAPLIILTLAKFKLVWRRLCEELYCFPLPLSNTAVRLCLHLTLASFHVDQKKASIYLSRSNPHHVLRMITDNALAISKNDECYTHTDRHRETHSIMAPCTHHGMKRRFCLKAKKGLGRFAPSALPHYEEDFLPYRQKTASVTSLPRACLITSSCLLYTSPSPRDLSTSRMPSSA